MRSPPARCRWWIFALGAGIHVVLVLALLKRFLDAEPLAKEELLSGRTILTASLGAVSLGAALACVSRKDFWMARAPAMAYVLVMLGVTVAWSSLGALRPVYGCGNCIEAHAGESLLERFRCTWSWPNVLPGMVVLTPFAMALLTKRLGHLFVDASHRPDDLG